MDTQGIIKDYTAGINNEIIMKKYNIPISKLYRIIRDNNVPLKHEVSAIIGEIKAFYKDQYTIEETVNLTGHSESVVKSVFMQEDIKSKKRPLDLLDKLKSKSGIKTIDTSILEKQTKAEEDDKKMEDIFTNFMSGGTISETNIDTPKIEDIFFKHVAQDYANGKSFQYIRDKYLLTAEELYYTIEAQSPELQAAEKNWKRPALKV